MHGQYEMSGMRSALLLSLSLVTASALAPPAAAQTADLVPWHMTAAIGAGFGAATISCEGCTAPRESNVAGTARAGVAVRRNIAIAIEATGWTKDFGTPGENATTRLGFADLTVQWYPMRAAGLYLKGGGGASAIREDIAASGLQRTSITAHSSAVVVGLGWDVPVVGHWGVAPYLDYHRASNSRARVNGISSSTMVGATLLHIGVAATWR
jgi:hypothetical protein